MRPSTRSLLVATLFTGAGLLAGCGTMSAAQRARARAQHAQRASGSLMRISTKASPVLVVSDEDLRLAGVPNTGTALLRRVVPAMGHAP